MGRGSHEDRAHQGAGQIETCVLVSPRSPIDNSLDLIATRKGQYRLFFLKPHLDIEAAYFENDPVSRAQSNR